MAMTQAQIDAELQRKRNLGIQPTNPANQAAYNKLTPAQPTFAAYGGRDNYVNSQNQRWMQANQNNDTDLMSRLIADSQRVGYSLNPYSAPQPAQQQSPWENRSNDLYDKLAQALSNPFEMPTFNFNPESDPRYIQAMQIADQNATQATGNAMAALASRGIENGSIMGDRAAQIQQQERGRVSGQLVPQLYAQAYDQFANEQSMRYRAQQDQLAGWANLLGIANNQHQLGLDNLFRDKSFDRGVLESDRAFNRGVLESDRNYNYQVGRDRVGDDQWLRQFERGILESDRSFDRGVLESDRDYNRGVLESDRDYALNRSRESRISSSGSGGGSGGSTPKPVNLNTVIDNINKLYTTYANGTRSINNKNAIKSYIDSIGLPDDQRAQLYNYYGLSSSSFNLGDVLRNAAGDLWGRLTGSGNSSSSSLSDDEIRQYLR